MAKSSLMGKLLEAAGKGSRATVLSQSNLFEKGVLAQTDVPLVNIMMGGSLDGGIVPGSTMLIGDSRTFKTNFCLLHVASFMRTYEDAICVFFDSEFGATKYFDQFGIDKDRVIHIPLENIEELKRQATKILTEINPGDKVIVLFDSMSQIASLKEVEDALKDNGAADMTRAKQLNSFWRIITPMLNLRQIPMYTINSFYDDTTNKYADPIVKGGKQGFLSADQLFMVTRAQVKDDTVKDKGAQLTGWTFNYKVMKSRSVKEKAIFPITVLFNGGIQKYSGMLEIARLGGFIDMPVSGWYTRTEKCGFKDEKKYRKADCDGDEFWDPIIKNEDFRAFVKNRFSLESGAMMEDVDPATGEILDVFNQALASAED